MVQEVIHLLVGFFFLVVVEYNKTKQKKKKQCECLEEEKKKNLWPFYKSHVDSLFSIDKN